MKARIMLAVLAVCTTSSCAQENLVANGDFSGGLEGWRSSRGPAEPALDTDDCHSAPASLRLPGTAEMVGMVIAEDHVLAAPAPNALSISAWVKADRVAPGASIGIDLKIVLDDGATTWFFPTSLQVQPEEAGRWVHKTGSYLAPTGRRIAAIATYCLNYRSGGATAWFDDIAVRAHTTAAPEHEVGVLYALSPDDAPVAAVCEALTAAGVAHDLVPRVGGLEGFRLVIMPEWVEDFDLYLRLKVFHYLGGRVVLMDLPEQQHARSIARYFWERSPAEITEPLLLADDGRAAHLRSGEYALAELGGLVRGMLATGIALPDEVPAIDFGPKAAYELRDGVLFAGDEPLLLRAMGTYAVDGSRPIEEHRANFAHFAELRLNGVVLYLSHATPLEHLTAVLDAAWERGLRAQVWLYGPRGVMWPEKPLKDEWVLRFMPLRRHPALLAWILCDDTWSRYLPFIEREAEVFRRYDESNLITTTLMDLRRPGNVPEQTWVRWREIVDFPLTYLYPLQKGPTFGGGEDIEGGLEDVQRLSEHARAIWGEPVYVQQWSQAHMQGHAYPKTGIPARSTYLPTPEQQRLLTYMMLTAGTRGILYFSSQGLADARLGMGRRAELGLLWGELEPVEDIIAAGTLSPCATSDPSVEAAAFTRGGDTVVLALKHGEQYNRHVSDAVVRNVRITLPLDPPEGARCLRLDGPRLMRVMPLREGRELTLDELDVTAALLITADEARIAAAQTQREAWGPLAARLGATAAADVGAKTHVIAERIAPLTGPEFAQLLLEGDEAFEKVVTYLGAQTHRQAWSWGRIAMRKWREAQALAIERAEAEHARRGLGDEALLLLNIYPALPNFAHEYLGAPEPDYAAMHEEVNAWLARYEFLTREPGAER
ncbi:MAG: hypothetical protein AB7Y46_11830 [Armatimonadota bacterium]